MLGEVSNRKVVGLYSAVRRRPVSKEGLRDYVKVFLGLDVPSQEICERLIEAMRCYHYPENARGAKREKPVKDGVYDPPIDALRYFFVNFGRGKAKSRKY